MTTADDVKRVDEAFLKAFGKLSLEATQRASALWERFHGDSEAVQAFMRSQTGAWDRGARLSVAYYRLLAAVSTGRTVPDPRRGAKGGAGEVTLAELVADFVAASGVELHLSIPGTHVFRFSSPPGGAGVGFTSGREGAANHAAYLLEERADAQKKAADRGVNVSGRGAADAVFLGGVGQMLVGAGMRDALGYMGDRDSGCIGWARVSGTGRPCHFCAMLLSRKAVYKSRRSAHGARLEGYHPHCRCYVRPVFSREELETSSLFALNRKFHAEWYQHGKDGVGGRTGSTWRKHFYKTYGR